MARKYWQLPYDESLDADIVQWLESMPRDRKWEMVRTAMRYYMAATAESQTPYIPVIAPPPVRTENKVEEKPKRVPKLDRGGMDFE